MDEQQPTIERVVVVQAMNSTPGNHWYETLVGRLEAAGATVLLPAMPTPFDPKPAAWHEAIAEAVGTPDARTLLVAHSVGNAATLQWLSALPAGWSLGGLVNVGGFTEPQPGNDATPPFVEGIDHDLIRDATQVRHAFIGTDDPEVPNDLSERLAERLDSTVHRIDGAGHFRDEDGYTSFPQLEALALGWLAS